MAILCLMVAGCGQQEDTEKKEVKKEEVQKEAVAPAKDPLVVGFIYVGPIGDGGWTFAQDQGRLELEKAMNVKTIYKESCPEGPEVKEIIRNMVDQGAQLIFAGSFGYMDYVEEISKEFPQVKFSHCSGYKQTENMANHFGRMYEPRFLSGLVAGLKTETNKIGYVAAFEIPEVIRGINAFTLGVKAVNPEASVNVRWTHTWYDPAKEKEAAKALLDESCDIIAQHQDTAGPQQAAEERGVFSIGYNSDMKDMAPKAYMTAPVWDWAPYYIDQVKAVQDGTWKTHSFWGGLKDEIVKLADLTANAPEGAAKEVDAYTAKIKDGSFHVFAGPIKNQAGTVKVDENTTMSDKDMLGMDWFVEGVVGKIKSE
ncbi:MAG: BMP family ABC transporter substrate-binding protein [Desulfobacter sp.]|nr:MAG: BMP family ABC transporter substrate-binding protein [Desulfobacter sp.]